MNGKELINNLIDELARAKDMLLDLYEGTEVVLDDCWLLISDIREDLDRYYDVADSIDAVVEDIEVYEEDITDISPEDLREWCNSAAGIDNN